MHLSGWRVASHAANRDHSPSADPAEHQPAGGPQRIHAQWRWAERHLQPRELPAAEALGVQPHRHAGLLRRGAADSVGRAQ